MRSIRDALTLLVLVLLVLSVRIAPLSEAIDGLVPDANAADGAAPAVRPEPNLEKRSNLPASLDSMLLLDRQEIHGTDERRCRMLEASVTVGDSGEGRVIYVLEIDAGDDIEVRTETIDTEIALAWSPRKSC